ncbi:MAG: EAL domain-containing protein, partial [Zoogloeaceae bacterium]|nr:EAL domain-containing protein [Zoogloeaceae bacterium]
TMQAIRGGFVLCLPLVVTGALAVLLNNLPLDAYQELMLSLFGPGWRQGFFAKVWQCTVGILSLPMIVGISYNLTLVHNQRHPLTSINPVLSGIVALASFMVMLPADNFVPELGVQGLFVAILVSVAATHLFLRLASVRCLQLRIYSEGIASAPHAFANLATGILTVLAFSAFDFGFRAMTDLYIHDAIGMLLLYPFQTLGVHNMLDTGLIYVSITHLTWFFGLHGTNVLDPLTRDLFEAATLANITAYEQGLPPPHIVTKSFLDIFVFMGGAGTSISLLVAILLASRERGSRRLARLSLVPGVFNINEIVLFGLPVILNPIYFLPFLITPIVLTLNSYLAVRYGLVTPPVFPLEWTTPPIVGGFLATKDVSGAFLQIFNLALGVFIYLPFVKISDRLKVVKEKEAQRELLQVALSNTVGPSGKKCLDREDAVGALARILAHDLEAALKSGEGLYLEYQPQVDARTGRVIGAEALMRWQHPSGGSIPAPVIIAIAEDGEFILPLGLWVLNETCAERARWNTQGLEPTFKTAVNVSIQQLSDADLPEKILACVDKHRLSRRMIGIEVTESIALDPDAQHNQILNRIHEHGFAISMDDFGMGHSSLVYLKHFPVDVLKIDKVLSQDVANPTCAEIISTIVELCRALGTKIVVEFVDNQKQIERLNQLGCHVYQGYYYSPPLSGEAMLAYAQKMNAAAERRAAQVEPDALPS